MTTTNHNDLFEKTIAVSISFGALCNQRKASLSDVTVDADKDRLNLTAKILQCDEMRAIRAAFTAAREEIVDTKRGLTLPTLFKRGVYLVPVAKIGDVEAKLTARREQLAELVENLILVYDERIEEDRQRLRSKFNAKHYPSKAALRSTFTITWRYLSLTPNSQLKTISNDLYQKEVARVQAECAELGETIKQTMRAAALDLLTSMRERLGYNDDGTPKIFRNSLVSNLTTFLDNFEFKNVVDDQELASTLATVRNMLAGVDADTLRNNEGLRSAVQAEVNGIIGELEGMVTVAARRVVVPADDESEAA